jgi:hypothetical protein
LHRGGQVRVGWQGVALFLGPAARGGILIIWADLAVLAAHLALDLEPHLAAQGGAAPPPPAVDARSKSQRGRRRLVCKCGLDSRRIVEALALVLPHRRDAAPLRVVWRDTTLALAAALALVEHACAPQPDEALEAHARQLMRAS